MPQVLRFLYKGWYFGNAGQHEGHKVPRLANLSKPARSWIAA